MTQNKENYKDASVLVVISLDASETFTRVRKTPSNPIKLLFYRPIAIVRNVYQVLTLGFCSNLKS